MVKAIVAGTGRRPPLVSIGLPVFNGEETVKRALGSLIGQDYPNIEIIVSDNASTDRTARICKRVLRNHPRARVIEQPVNRGPHANFAAVLTEATGEYFMWAADDDVWLPSFVSRLVAELEDDPGSCVAMCATELVDGSGQKIDTIRFRGRTDPNGRGPLRLGALVLTPYKFNYFIYGLYRTELLRKGIRHWPAVLGGDRMFVAQFAFGRRFRYVDEVHYRRTDQPAHRAAYKDEERKAEARAAQVAAFVRMIVGTEALPFWRKLGVPHYAVLYAAFVYRKDIGRMRDLARAVFQKAVERADTLALGATIVLGIALVGALVGVFPSEWIRFLPGSLGLAAILFLVLQHGKYAAEIAAVRKDLRQLRDLIEKERSEASTGRHHSRKAMGGMQRALLQVETRLAEAMPDPPRRAVTALVGGVEERSTGAVERPNLLAGPFDCEEDLPASPGAARADGQPNVAD